MEAATVQSKTVEESVDACDPQLAATLRVQPLILDPYVRQPEFTLPFIGRVLLFLLDLILVPLRIFFLVLFMVLLWMCCKVLLIGAVLPRQAGSPCFGQCYSLSLMRFTIQTCTISKSIT